MARIARTSVPVRLLASVPVADRLRARAARATEEALAGVVLQWLIDHECQTLPEGEGLAPATGEGAFDALDSVLAAADFYPTLAAALRAHCETVGLKIDEDRRDMVRL